MGFLQLPFAAEDVESTESTEAEEESATSAGLATTQLTCASAKTAQARTKGTCILTTGDRYETDGSMVQRFGSKIARAQRDVSWGDAARGTCTLLLIHTTKETRDTTRAPYYMVHTSLLSSLTATRQSR